MSRLYFFHLFWILFMLQGCGTSRKATDSKQAEIIIDQQTRTYIFDKFSGSEEKSPLLIALHGGLGSGAQMKESYALGEMARQHEYSIVYPDGIAKRERLKLRTWNAGGCCGYAAESGVNDVNFISQLIDKLIDEEGVDPKRIYVTGMSNGAMMAYKLACEIPEKITAIAPVAGYVLPENDCGSAVPIIHFHSIKDENVPFDGGVGKGLSGFDFPSFEEVTSAWAAINGCQKGVRSINMDGFTLYEWGQCNVPMKYYITEDGGHSWPGASSKPRERADDPSSALNANELMFKFFDALQK